MKYWVWLSQLKGVGPVTQKKLLQHFHDPELIYAASGKELLSIDGIGAKLSEAIIAQRSLEQAHAILDEVNSKEIKILTYGDPLYPNKAKKVDYAPAVLYYKGGIKKDILGVGIVGARRCTEYGKRIAVEAAEYLAYHGIPVISGMARGIDGYAHIACLKAGGYTIAFLGNGIDITYPKEHNELQLAIIEKGAVVSEYPPGTMVRPENFPKRNGLISSWCDKLLVVEAAEKSGALITAEYGKLHGRQVLVPPHEIYSRTGRGTNRLLLKGAIPYLDPSQLLPEGSFLGGLLDNSLTKSGRMFQKQQKGSTGCKQGGSLTTEEKLVKDALMDRAYTVEEIERLTGVKQIRLIEILSILELKGEIKAVPGGRFAK